MDRCDVGALHLDHPALNRYARPAIRMRVTLHAVPKGHGGAASPTGGVAAIVALAWAYRIKYPAPHRPVVELFVHVVVIPAPQRDEESEE